MTFGYPLKFGKYLLLERVNVGGMAEVFKAKTFGVAGFERILAIKRILPSLVEDEEFIRMFIDEARIAVQLNHANIVQIYELGKHGEHYYIAMEYLPSRDLRGILDKMRLGGQLMPIPQAAYTISKVCEGLDYAHRRRDPAGNPMNIIHRDVSPQNILVSYEGEIKIIDFGIAKAANRASKTQAGVLKGKFGYMSPEQVRGLPIDRRSDIFAVGVLLYEMLTGERLFIGESDFSTLERVRNAEVPPPTSFNKKITPELEQIVLKALARETEDRYQWASELAEDLQRFLIEDRSIYSAKRLAAYMKETYADLISAERRKMEEFISMSDDVDLDVDDDDDLVPDPAARPPQLPPEASAPGDGIDFEDDAPEFEEDKTFVIEASEAAKELVPDTGGGDPAGRAPRIPTDPTNDEFLNEASLYGGDDYDDLDDDAKTEVSFVNPFDENISDENDGHTDPGVGGAGAMSVPPPPLDSMASDMAEAETTVRPPESMPSQTNVAAEPASATQAAPPMATSQAPPPSMPSVPPPSASGGFDPVAAAMAEDAAAYSGDPSPGLDGTAPGAPGMGTVEQPQGPPHTEPTPDDIAGPQMPSAAALQAPVVNQAEARKVPMGCVIGLIAMIGFGLLATIGTGVTLYVILTAGPTLELQAMGAVEPPGAIEIVLGEEVLATQLPDSIELDQTGDVSLVVRGEGLKERTFKVRNLVSREVRRVRVPVTLAKAGAGADRQADAAQDDTEQVANKGDGDQGDTGGADPGDKPAPDGKEEGKDDAEHVADNQGDGDKADKGGDGDDKKDDGEGEQIAAASDGADPLGKVGDDSWRLSFTAFHRTKRRTIRGARVFAGEQQVGTTPFEIELDGAVNEVAFRIEADGFSAREVAFARNGRVLVGPTSVPLDREGAATGAATDDNDDDTAETGEDDDGKEAKAEQKDEEQIAAADTPEEKQASDEAEPADDSKTASADGADDRDEDKAAAAPEQAEQQPTRVASKRSTKPKKSNRRSAPKQAKPSKAKKPAKAKDDKPAADAQANLSVGSRPRARVFIDRKSYGMTPLMHKKAISLSPGKHFMMLEDPETKQRAKFKLNVQAGKGVIIYDFGNKKVLKKKGPIKVNQL